MIPVQILLPVYNSEASIKDTVKSLLNQTYRDFELIIIDDASTDRSLTIIEKLSLSDNRIKVIKHAKNQGIIACRNKLIKVASSPLIAFSDSDDLYMLDRISLQVNYLNSHPEIVAVSGGFNFIGDKSGGCYPPQGSVEIQAALSLFNAFPNPAVMVRREALIKHHIFCNDEFRGAADFLMWQELSNKEMLANLPDILFHYRVHSAQESTINRVRQENNHLRVVNNNLSKLGIEVATSSQLSPLIYPEKYANKECLIEVGRYVERVIAQFSELEGNYNAYIKIWDIRYRSLCRFQGAIGLIGYLKTLGIKRLVTGKNVGLSFIKACLTQKLR